MVTGKDISSIKQEIRMLEDREKREKELFKLQEQKEKLERDHALRHESWFIKGGKETGRVLKTKLIQMEKQATSPSAKKKYKKAMKILGGI